MQRQPSWEYQLPIVEINVFYFLKATQTMYEHSTNINPIVFIEIMAGEYVLRIGTSLGSDIFYPGVLDVKKAKIFEIQDGTTTKGDFSILSLKAK